VFPVETGKAMPDDNYGDGDGEDLGIPEQAGGMHESYYSNVGPFAADADLSDEQFGYYQDLYHAGFVQRGGQNGMARQMFIDALYARYGEEFDWAAWRAEYEASNA
jgi:hypothetical protein